MCGITGFITKKLSPDSATHTAECMASKLAHRGPDDCGVWRDKATGVCLGHRRLSIIDTSQSGHQPMISSDGQWALVFNGEIYNYKELKKELEAEFRPQWRGTSDTEVLLQSLALRGLESTLEKIDGMFAFAAFDKTEQMLYLCRDRFGEKPLYYAQTGNEFMFASELKALRAYPGFESKISKSALSLYGQYNFVPAPYSIYEDVWKLPPASFVRIKVKDKPHASPPEKYWSLASVAANGSRQHLEEMNEGEACRQLEQILGKAVSRCMISDVPLGAMLSGGVDSSLVVALMQKHSKKPVKTFSIGVDAEGYDESENAAAVARHLGTEHTEFKVTAKDIMDAVPAMGGIYDEPFADSSQVPTYLVSKLAREHVTVCITGDGADELFCGYNRYFLGDMAWRKTSGWPLALRKMSARFIHAIRPQWWNTICSPLSCAFGKYSSGGTIGGKMHKLADILALKSQDEVYHRLASVWGSGSSITATNQNTDLFATMQQEAADITDPVRRMMFFDQTMFLPSDMLTKVDRAAMAVSLECRIPFLCREVAEFSWSLSNRLLLENGSGKRILKNLLYSYVPKEIIDRPKHGFAIPVGDWLRTGLKDWAYSLLDERALKQQEFFDHAKVARLWSEHVSGRKDWGARLWGVLMFQEWWRNQRR